MTHDKDTMSDIERNEAWLREAMPADPPAPLERAKLRVRIELNHAWLKRNAAPDPSAAGLEGVKRAVRAEMAGLAAGPASRRVRLPIRRSVGLAAAAVILLAVGLALYGSSLTRERDEQLAARLDNWVDAVQLDALASDDEVADLVELEDRMASLEMSLVEDGPAAWGWEELGELSDELDVLLTDIG